MYITTLRLFNFRNIEKADLQFSDGINIIYGNNAQGKTNIIESVFFASTGRSHRTRSDRELIRFNEKNANIKVVFKKRAYFDNIEVSIKTGEKKGIAINGMPIKRIGELFGQLQSVIFSPEDLNIVNDSPSERRRFMDIQICQIDKIYYYHLHMYHKVLKQRNSLLKQKNSQNLRDSIFVWDAQLVEHGCQIIEIRKKFIESINTIGEEIHYNLTGGKERFEANYKPDVYTDAFEKKLLRTIDKDILYGSTSTGPHKDDLTFYVNGRDAKTFGSQGQKRTVILSCKLAEAAIVKNETGGDPVLLLDDAMSELDGQRQEMLLKYIGNMQTIITATGMEDMICSVKKEAKLFNIDNGVVKGGN